MGVTSASKVGAASESKMGATSESKVGAAFESKVGVNDGKPGKLAEGLARAGGAGGAPFLRRNAGPKGIRLNKAP